MASSASLTGTASTPAGGEAPTRSHARYILLSSLTSKYPTGPMSHSPQMRYFKWPSTVLVKPTLSKSNLSLTT
eukprot:CAMPEP_0185166088 /NCGR_PEP_ID=MMETSP1139-20130426/11976_1 /TAXON_ID=298111 /ORGANISM="Pavlova sp., Strain CCMP459" /LENGTH=72 /DNA_ID=CAMNT_0027731521 /DNA_START=528 /DNA_END=746 /DNA_ORIENTATION=+